MSAIDFIDQVDDLIDKGTAFVIKEIDGDMYGALSFERGENVHNNGLYISFKRRHFRMSPKGKLRFLRAEKVDNTFTIHYGNCVIHGAGYTPTLIFHGDERFFFGQELEFVFPSEEATKAAAQAFNNFDPEEKFFWVKNDCSLPEGKNLEVVTHPCCFEVAADLAQKICSTASQFNATNENCGHHCHVNRNQLSTEVIANLLLIVDERWADIERFSGRSTAALNAWAGNPLNDIKDKKTIALDIARGDRYVGRNCAINTVNDDTVEFRFAAGTTDGIQAVLNLKFFKELLNKAQHDH